MHIKGNLHPLDLKILETAFSDGAAISAQLGSSHLIGTSTVKVHSEGWGTWYLFGGYMMSWGLIQADNFSEAYEAYLEQFVPCDDPDADDELFGTYDSCGGWYSEATTSNILHANIHVYDLWDIEITPGKHYSR